MRKTTGLTTSLLLLVILSLPLYANDAKPAHKNLAEAEKAETEFNSHISDNDLESIADTDEELVKRKREIADSKASIEADINTQALGEGASEDDKTKTSQAVKELIKARREGADFAVEATAALNTLPDSVAKNLLKDGNKAIELLGLNEAQTNTLKAALTAKAGTNDQLMDMFNKNKDKKGKDLDILSAAISQRYANAKKVKGNILPSKPLDIPGKTADESKLLALQANEQMQIIKDPKNKSKPEVQDEAAKKLGQIIATAIPKSTDESITFKERLTKPEFTGEFANMLRGTFPTEGQEKLSPNLSSDPRTQTALSTKFSEGFKSIPTTPNSPPPPVQAPAEAPKQAPPKVVKPEYTPSATQDANLSAVQAQVDRLGYRNTSLSTLRGSAVAVDGQSYQYQSSRKMADGSVQHTYTSNGQTIIWNNSLNNNTGGYVKPVIEEQFGQKFQIYKPIGGSTTFGDLENKNFRVLQVATENKANTRYYNPRPRLFRFRR